MKQKVDKLEQNNIFNSVEIIGVSRTLNKKINII